MRLYLGSLKALLRLKRREQAADSRFGRERVDETLLDELKDKAAELLELKDKAAEEAKALKEQLAAVETEWQRRLREASGEKERALALKDKVFEEATALKEQLAAVEAEWQRRLGEASGEKERAAEEAKAHRYQSRLYSVCGIAATEPRQSLNRALTEP